MSTVKLNRNNTNFVRQLFKYFRGAKWGDEYQFLKYYQNITRLYMTSVDVNSRGLLVYLTMGLGKSILAISIAMDLIRERQPIILLTKSLKENMRRAIHQYITMRAEHDHDYPLARMSAADIYHWIDKNFAFVSMNASNMMAQMGKAAEGRATEEFDAALEKKIGEVLKLPSLDGKLLIVDEAHNLFRAITNGSKNAQELYELVMKAKNLKLLFLTGTPVANDPFELVPCFNMLIGRSLGRPLLPESYREFYRLYVDEQHGRIKNKGQFQNRLFGLVSHVNHQSEPGKAFGVTGEQSRAEFPQELPMIVEFVPMDVTQYVSYQLARDKEREEGSYGRFAGPKRRGVPQFYAEPLLTKPKSKAASTYRVRSRQLSNYSPPPGFTEETDPARLPASSLASAKYRRMYRNILQHVSGSVRQLGIVYSQFTGVGGLGTFARFLDINGWSRVEIRGSRANIVRTFQDNPAPGEQGELDEYAQSKTMIGDIRGDEHTTYSRSVIGGRDAVMPSVMEYLHAIETEVETAGYRPFGGGDDDDIESSSGIAAADDEFDISTAIVDETVSSPQPILNFTYASAADVAMIKQIDPDYADPARDMEYPRAILLVYSAGECVGYATVEFTMLQDSSQKWSVSACRAEVIRKHLPADIDQSLLLRLLHDSIKCESSPDEFRARVWGSSGDIAAAGGNDNDGSAARGALLKGYKYAIISGDVPVEDRAALQEIFNSDENKHGGRIDLILLSSTGAEGLDLKNVRHIHIMEPYWNWGRIKQIVARGVRNNSHVALPDAEKNVQPYIYLATPPESERLPDGEMPETTDTELYNESLKNQLLVDSFTEALQEISIECLVNDESYCRVCAPTDDQLFTNDPAHDVLTRDPCVTSQEEHIVAEEIIIGDKRYYFVKDSAGVYGYRIFEYDKTIDGYRPLLESDPLFIKIVDAIESNRGK